MLLVHTSGLGIGRFLSRRKPLGGTVVRRSVFEWVKWKVVMDGSLQGVCIKLDDASLSDGYRG